jgi:hypothetical protein
MNDIWKHNIQIALSIKFNLAIQPCDSLHMMLSPLAIFLPVKTIFQVKQKIPDPKSPKATCKQEQKAANDSIT